VELEPRTTAPAHATGAVEFVPLAAISDDATFRLRDEGDVSALAASIGRLGQLVPLEVRPLPGAPGDGARFQVVAGFRRLAALRLLARDRVLARVHGALSDEDAWALALSEALVREPLLGSEIEALRERLPATGAAPWAEELVDPALVRAPVDPALRERFLEFLSRPAQEEGGGTVEVTIEELARELPRRLFEVNQDLALAVEAWADLPAEARLTILEQARWVAGILPMIGGGREEGEE
jgi:ParB family chromosome partitioning protein